MVMEILTYPDDCLAGKCASVPVEEIDDGLRAFVEDMVETMYVRDGVGLAAPQVGKNIRLIVLDQTGPREKTDLRVIFNPEIVERSGQVDWDESCLSCPGLTVKIQRNQKVTVRGLDRRGEPLEISADGLLAIILQHEIDHLDGVLIVDHAGRLKRSMYEKKVRKWQKKDENG